MSHASEHITLPDHHEQSEPKKVLAYNEQSEQKHILSEEIYIQTKLSKEYPGDGIRPTYEVDGLRFCFRNSGEAPQLPHAVYADQTYKNPLPSANQEAVAQQIEQYSTWKLDRDSCLVATTTPEGVMRLCERIIGDIDEQFLIGRYEDDLRRGDISTPRIQRLTDEMIAAVAFDENNDPAEESSNTDGLALVVAAYCGDMTAMQLLDQKLNMLYQTLEAQQREVEIALARGWATRQESRAFEGSEMLGASEVALVHSTSHRVERDDEGNVILQPLAAHTDSAQPYARSSLHFTPNGQVASHSYGAWDQSNKLIVTNMQETIDRNGLPASMNSSDTYFTRSPGEVLVLPGALVVEPVENIEDGSIIAEDSEGCKYVARDDYTDKQKQVIAQLVVEYGITSDGYSDEAIVREAALRMTEERLGVREYTTIGQNYAMNDAFAQRYATLAESLGVGMISHMNSTDYAIERAVQGFSQESDWNDNPTLRFSMFQNGKLPSLDAMRTAVWAGYLPAVDIAKAHTKADARINSGLEY